MDDTRFTNWNKPGIHKLKLPSDWTGIPIRSAGNAAKQHEAYKAKKIIDEMPSQINI